jgi:hypothetical protein
MHLIHAQRRGQNCLSAVCRSSAQPALPDPQVAAPLRTAWLGEARGGRPFERRLMRGRLKRPPMTGRKAVYQLTSGILFLRWAPKQPEREVSFLVRGSITGVAKSDHRS